MHKFVLKKPKSLAARITGPAGELTTFPMPISQPVGEANVGKGQESLKMGEDLLYCFNGRPCIRRPCIIRPHVDNS